MKNKLPLLTSLRKRRSYEKKKRGFNASR